MFSQYNNIFIVGIKGVAMANIARIFVQMGKKVSGSDVAEEFITDHTLEDIQIVNSFEKDALPPDAQIVIYSAAHNGEQNPQVQEAIRRGIIVIHQAEVIGDLLNLFTTSIAVAGCHGKTTTSSLLSYALTKLGVQPSYLVGVSEFDSLPGGEFGKKDYFVLEADEYAMNPPDDKTPKFHHFYPTHALVMNIDFDHPDVYEGIEDTKEAFKTFLANVAPPKDYVGAYLVLCADDEPVREVAKRLDSDRYITYGTTVDSDVVVSDIKATETGMEFKLTSSRLTINDTFFISLYGDKNVLNAVGVISMLRLLGFTLSQIQVAIEAFIGPKRRFELLHQIGESYIFDDYAHHPHEIEATIQAARTRFPNKRIVVIFQPHTFTRTQMLKDEFVHALAAADTSLIAPIFGSAREQVSENAISSKDLEKYAKAEDIQNVTGYDTTEELIHDLPTYVKLGDVVFTMGAGDIYKLAPEIVKMMNG